MPLLRIDHRDSADGLTLESTDAEIRQHPKIREEYGNLLDKYPDHPVVMSTGRSGRVVRWKGNSVIELIVERFLDMNTLWTEVHQHDLPIEDLATLYRMMGYSLCGFVEVFGGYMEEI